MTKNTTKVENLPTEKELITNTQDCVKYIQQIQNHNETPTNVDHLLLHIKAVIDKELWQPDERSSIQYNQVVVNVAFRCYYQVLKKNNIEDKFYGQFIDDNFNQDLLLKEKNFIVLQYLLLTNQSLVLQPQIILHKLLTAFMLSVDFNHVSLMSILKSLNLLSKKFPKLNFDFPLSLDHVYFCLQSNQMGMRDECMSLLQFVCSNRELALQYFQSVVNYWPWTNRNKLFVLGCILNKYILDECLQASNHDKEDFFLGLRSTLNYKNLLAPSQYVVKALSGQKSLQLLEMSVNILTLGNKKEIQNFHAQWFSRIQQKDELFEMLQQKPEIALFIDNSSDYLMDNEHSYRLILIFSMFSKQVFLLSKLHFFKLSTELLTNCFQYDTECQLLIFKFIVDNLANFAIEDCMEFVESFLRTHSSVDNAQFRNTILGKMPNIINYIAKTFCKLCLNSPQTSSLESSILNFFLHLQKDIEQGIASDIYQPKIFCLKLLEILLKSLYTETVTKNAKNCCVSQNQQLGLFLKEHKVFDSTAMEMRLMELLNDPLGFDDALDLIVELLKIIKPQEVVINLALDLTQRACSLADVDECNLCFLYARVAVQNCQSEDTLKEFLNIILSNLQENLPKFDKDPLLACKTQGGHLFGLINVLYELTQFRPEICCAEFLNFLQIVEQIQTLVIKKLNVAVVENAEEILSAASFEDMDKSLEMLVCQSSYESEDHDLCRKYLLMSFWLTLKACCDLASSMAIYEVKKKPLSEQSCSFLQRCLQVNVMVLTKCRHKGAIESAGVAIGKLTKAITSHLDEDTEEFNLLHLCLQQLYEVKESNVSTTRRGAGFSIMFLHVVKNEDHRGRPILKRAVENLLNPNLKSKDAEADINCDRLEALYLHFLCVLVRDTELREAMSKYYNEIMMAAVKQIDNPEWTVCNAALQLFGALVPKIVGQKQANEFENPLPWEPSEVTFSEINRKLPKACVYILNYCLAEKSSTRSIILFLEFLHKVEYIYKGILEEQNPVYNYRQLMWSLLQHNAEKVRKLAAKCLIRAHEFRVELPEMLQQITSMIFSVKNENFFEGLVYTLQEGILKLQHESKHIIAATLYQQLEQQIKQNLQETFPSKCLSYKFFTLCKLWDLLKLLQHYQLMEQLKVLAQPQNKVDKMLGYDLWLERIEVN
ncbi:hypothetical protein FF38_12778 [Lucilia cuprina]|uniref:DUF2428 domain-containing protein n=1 Tax=Lucilia cuprina TaxID=7375 RepID=A0A0L0CH33_LUCCU|nr:hypothetical protein FF38_12778 [Lucilia cuprina]